MAVSDTLFSAYTLSPLHWLIKLIRGVGGSRLPNGMYQQNTGSRIRVSDVLQPTVLHDTA